MDSRSPASDTGQSGAEPLWPLPPMCGVLGVALTWHVPDPATAGGPGAEVIRRQAAIWGLESAVADAAVLLVHTLLSDAVRHGTGQLLLALALKPGFLGVAVYECRDSGWAAPGGTAEHGLRAVAVLAHELEATAVPGGEGHAFTALLALDESHPARPGARHPRQKPPAPLRRHGSRHPVRRHPVRTVPARPAQRPLPRARQVVRLSCGTARPTGVRRGNGPLSAPRSHGP